MQIMINPRKEPNESDKLAIPQSNKQRCGFYL